MCASWAAIGECEANPVYMTGAGRHRGHCEMSCGMCDSGGGQRELGSGVGSGKGIREGILEGF